MSTRAATGLLDRRRAVLQVRHRRRRTMLLVGVTGCAAVAGAWWVANGPLLAVTDVQISGYRQADQARVVETVRIASRDGTMLKLPTVAVRESLASFPWVADVSVHHNWLRGIDVRIVQATPAAVAVTPSGERLLVSDTGRVLGDDPGGLRLPAYRAPELAVGATLRGPAQRAPFAFLAAMAPATARRVQDLAVVNGVLVGRLADGPELRAGPPREVWAKARALDAILAAPRLRESLAAATYLDLSAPKQPTLGGVRGATGVGETPSDAGDAGTTPPTP